MAKGDVTLKFDASTAQFVQDVLKAKEAVDLMKNKSREMGDAVSDAGDKITASMRKASAEIEKTHAQMQGIILGTLGANGIEQVLGTMKSFVVDTASNYFGKMEDKADRMLSKMKLVNGALAATGQGDRGEYALEKINTMRFVGHREVDTEEAAVMLSNVTKAVGNKLSVDEDLEAVRVGLLARAGRMPEEAANRAAINYAQLKRFQHLGGGLELTSEQEMQNMAKQATEANVDLDDKRLRFLSLSSNKKEAFNLLLAAGENNASSRGLVSLENAMDLHLSDSEVRHLHEERRREGRKFVGSEGERRLRLNAIPDPLRLEAVNRDPSLLPESERPFFANLIGGLAHIKPVESFQAAAEKVEMSRDLQHERDAADLRAKHTRDIDAVAELKYQNELAAKKAAFDEQHPFLSSIPGYGFAVRHGAIGAPALVNQTGGEFMDELRSPESNQRELLKATREQTELIDSMMGQMLSNLRGNTALKSNHEGQK